MIKMTKALSILPIAATLVLGLMSGTSVDGIDAATAATTIPWMSTAEDALGPGTPATIAGFGLTDPSSTSIPTRSIPEGAKNRFASEVGWMMSFKAFFPIRTA